jgi:hypothetical protein
MPFKMEMTKFRKVASDKNSTTMEHPDGHKIIIAHSGLSPKLRSALAELPIMSATQDQKKEMSMAAGGHMPNQEDMCAEGGEIQGVHEDTASKGKSEAGRHVRMAEGIKHEPTKEKELNEAKLQHKLVLAQQRFLPKPQLMADGGSTKDDTSYPSQQSAEEYDKGASAPGWENYKYRNPQPTPTPTPQPAWKSAAFHSKGGEIPNGVEGNTAQPGPSPAVTTSYKKGGVACYADGTPDSAVSPDNKQPTIIINNHPPQQGQTTPPDIVSTQTSPQGPQAAATNIANQKSAEMAAQKAANVEPSDSDWEGSVGHAPAPTPAPSALPAAGQQATTQTGAAPQSDVGSYSATYVGGLQQHIAGIGAEAAATGALGATRASILGGAATATDQVIQDAQQSYNANMEDYKNFVNELRDPNSHINPNHYLDSLSTGGKIMTGIGLILGGMGGGLTHQGNPALDFINKQIDRDIAAQQVNLGTKKSLLESNMLHFGNIRDGLLMSTAQLRGAAAVHMEKAAALYQDPIAQARAQQAIGQLHQSAAGMISLIGGGSAPGGAQGAAPPQNQGAPEGQMPQKPHARWLQMMQFQNPEQYKLFMPKYDAATDQFATRDLTNDDRANLRDYQTLDQKARYLYQWAQQHGGTLNPAVMGEGRVTSADLQNIYRASIHGGVYKQSEQDFINNVIPSHPDQFFARFRTLPQLSAVIQNNNVAHDIYRRDLGLPTISQPIPKAFKPKSLKVGS